MPDLTAAEWEKIDALFAADPYQYGLPKRIYGSVVLASFNIRKLGKVSTRSANTWEFLAQVCSYFDLLAIQETMADLEGFHKLYSLMGSDFEAVVSDTTGVFPGESGVGERMAFIYNKNLVKRGYMASDISYDRSKLLDTLIEHRQEIAAVLEPQAEYLAALKAWESNPQGKKPKRPTLRLPVFLTFIRQPFCVSFKIVGHPNTRPYYLSAVNAHLLFGDSIDDRRQEFDALMAWLIARMKEEDSNYFPNFVLLGDLNLDFDNPLSDRDRIEQQIKTFNQDMAGKAQVNFPFLDPHPRQEQPFRTNARLSETFDQIGFFSVDDRLPTSQDNATMGSQPHGPDYGVFNFVELFRDALEFPPIADMNAATKKDFFRKFEYEVSDHLPLWVRLPLP